MALESSEYSTLLNKDMATTEDSETMKRFQCGYIATTSVGILMVVMVFLWIIWDCNGFAWRSDPKTEFNWHPFLMTLGMLFLYGQAALIFRLNRFVEKERLKWIHAGLQFSVIIMIIIAQIAVLDSHNLRDPPIPNFYTLHSWLGLLAIFLFVIQHIGGFVAFLYPKLSTSLRRMLLPIHVHFGSAIFVLVTITCFSGVLQKAIYKLGKKYGDFPPEGIRINLIGMLMAIFCVMVLYLLKEEKYRRTPLPEEREPKQQFSMN